MFDQNFDQIFVFSQNFRSLPNLFVLQNFGFLDIFHLGQALKIKHKLGDNIC